MRLQRWFASKQADEQRTTTADFEATDETGGKAEQEEEGQLRGRISKKVRGARPKRPASRHWRALDTMCFAHGGKSARARNAVDWQIRNEKSRQVEARKR